MRRVRASWQPKYVPRAGDGCVLWLPGQDDPQSATIRDRSGLGNHGTLVGATWARTGKGLWVPLFDGSDDRIEIAAAASLNLTTAFSVEMWATVANTNDHMLFEKSIGEVNNTQFWIKYRVFAIYFACYKGTVQSILTSGSAPAINTWFHFVATYDNVNMRFYQAGVASGSPVALAGPIDGGAGKTFIGISPDLTGDHAGKTTLVKVYNVALTAAQVAAKFREQRGHFGI